MVFGSQLTYSEGEFVGHSPGSVAYDSVQYRVGFANCMKRKKQTFRTGDSSYMHPVTEAPENPSRLNLSVNFPTLTVGKVRKKNSS